jgi:hypothetical protein
MEKIGTPNNEGKEIAKGYPNANLDAAILVEKSPD